MKSSLTYKMFGAFVITSIVVIVFAVVSFRYFLHRDFAAFVNRAEIETLTTLQDSLAKEYRLQGDWNQIRTDPRHWKHLIARHLFHEDDRSTPPAPLVRHHIVPRLFLLDGDKNLVTGKPVSPEEGALLEIIVDAKIVGWLGLAKRHTFHRSPESTFLKRQTYILFVVGGGVLLLSALISFLFSRHFLAPITQLTHGTRELASRHFDVKINVRTNDELGQLASDFNAMARTLSSYETMREQWLSDISHELRTPLAVLRAEIEALQDGVRDVNPRTITSLHHEVMNISRLIDDLHRLSLADSGTLSMKRELLRPVAVLTMTVESFRGRFEEKGLTIDTSFVGDEKDWIITGDADHLGRLFSNLMENTLRYTDAPGMLKIRGHSSDTALTLVFDDSPPGVPEKSYEHLFDRLYRVDPARSRKSGGRGLGLSIAKAIVKEHGGTVRAADSPLGGLSIIIDLPLTGKATG